MAEGTAVNFDALEPRDIWRHFGEIIRIPRPSKGERKISEWIAGYAQRAGLDWAFQDIVTGEIGKVTGDLRNLRVSIPATRGHESASPVVLQSHLDMVCERLAASPYDPRTGTIHAYQNGDWVVADGTTLGADNGIGVAAMVAMIDLTGRSDRSRSTLTHGPIHLLFTADEEMGMTGAAALTRRFMIPANLQSRPHRRPPEAILLNLDSEDDGVITIGSAGGCDSHIDWRRPMVRVPSGWGEVHVEVHGLRGGHSGTDIGTVPGAGNRSRGNAIRILCRILAEFGRVAQVQNSRIMLGAIDGGNAPNAIPRECQATIFAPRDLICSLREVEHRIVNSYITPQKGIDPDAGLRMTSLEPKSGQALAFHPDEWLTLIRMMLALPCGPLEMNRHLHNTVDVSVNVAAIRSGPAHDTTDYVQVVTSSRSFRDTELDATLHRIREIAIAAGATCKEVDRYPGWAPVLPSVALDTVRAAYDRNPRLSPDIDSCARVPDALNSRTVAVHAGLECGFIAHRVPGLDQVSFGPDIRQVHQPGERVSICSVRRFWNVLCDTIVALSTPQRRRIEYAY